MSGIVGRARRAALGLGLLGCAAPPEDTGEGLLGAGPLAPFPNPLLVDARGAVAIPIDAVPVPDGGDPMPVDRFGGWRRGFSPGQPIVVPVPGVDPTGLVPWRAPTPGEGGARLLDLDTGAWLPVMAELDAWPDQPEPALLLRPLVALPHGHRVAVVLTTALVMRPERFDALLSGRPPASLAAWDEHFAALVERVLAAGVAEEELALAFDFPVDHGRAPLAEALAEAPLPSAWALGAVREAESGDDVAPFTWRAASGSFTVPDHLVNDDLLRVDPATGAISADGTRDHRLYVHVPDSVKDAPAGTVPVLLFGHGIFSTPQAYLNQDTDVGGVLQLVDELGAIVVATRWAGLEADHRVDALGAATNIGRLPLVPDRLADANLAVRALQRLILEGDLLDDPIFHGRDGQRLASGELVYYGISLGGIQGAVQVASGAPLDAAVLHVGGSGWATMLERSVHWAVFEPFVVETVPDPVQRQQLYALSQLFWDPVDPIAWTDGFGGAPVLWQESLGDEQVPNLGTRALARSAGAAALGAATEPAWGLPSAPRDGVHWAQFDPQVGLPPDVNRPAEITGAHDAPRRWPSQRAQALAFLDPEAPGTAIDPCGGAPCTAPAR